VRGLAAFLLLVSLSGPQNADTETRSAPVRFQVTTWGGISTVRLGGLDAFPVPATDMLVATWRKSFGERLVESKIRGVDLAAMDGIDLWYHVDQLVRVGAKFGYLRTGEGSMKTRTWCSTSSHVDEWNWSSEYLLLGAGAGFMLPVDRVSRFAFNLSLGTAWTTVNISHRYTWTTAGIPSFVASDAQATGTGFFPEFSVDYERDVFPGVVFGGRLGYRFGAVHEFRHVHDNSVNVINGGEPETVKGDTVRSADRQALLVDYGGIFANISLSSTF